jgi:hypothetical protein
MTNLRSIYSQIRTQFDASIPLLFIIFLLFMRIYKYKEDKVNNLVCIKAWKIDNY